METHTHQIKDFPRKIHKPRSSSKKFFNTGKWTDEEDTRLKQAVGIYNEKNWKRIATYVGGRTYIQCMHRWTKILKPGLVKGPWTKEEDEVLKNWVDENGPQKWSKIRDRLPGRSGKQCRERWLNSLDPNVKKGQWSKEEDQKIFKLFKKFGAMWSHFATEFEGRTENAIKNRFYSTLRRIATKYEKTSGSAVSKSKEDLLKYVDEALEVGHSCKSKRGRKRKYFISGEEEPEVVDELPKIEEESEHFSLEQENEQDEEYKEENIFEKDYRPTTQVQLNPIRESRPRKAKNKKIIDPDFDEDEEEEDEGELLMEKTQKKKKMDKWDYSAQYRLAGNNLEQHEENKIPYEEKNPRSEKNHIVKIPQIIPKEENPYGIHDPILKVEENSCKSDILSKSAFQHFPLNNPRNHFPKSISSSSSSTIKKSYKASSLNFDGPQPQEYFGYSQPYQSSQFYQNNYNCGYPGYSNPQVGISTVQFIPQTAPLVNPVNSNPEQKNLKGLINLNEKSLQILDRTIGVDNNQPVQQEYKLLPEQYPIQYTPIPENPPEQSENSNANAEVISKLQEFNELKNVFQGLLQQTKSLLDQNARRNPMQSQPQLQQLPQTQPPFLQNMSPFDSTSMPPYNGFQY